MLLDLSLLRLSPSNAAPERQVSALCSRWVTTRRMGEDAPETVDLWHEMGYRGGV
jgi:hypothetical protein